MLPDGWTAWFYGHVARWSWKWIAFKAMYTVEWIWNIKGCDKFC